MHTWAVVVATTGEVPPSVLEQLDRSAPSELTFPPSLHHRWSSADGRVHAAGWSHVSASEIGSYWEDRGSTLTAFSGRLWRDQTTWNRGRAWAAQLADVVAAGDIDREAERYTGMFTMLHLRADGRGWVTADPLGVAMVYRAERDGCSVITNQAALAASLVTLRRRRPPRDLEGAAHFAFAGSYHDEHTGFDAVRVVPQATVVHLATGTVPRAVTWSATPWRSNDREVDLATAVDRGRERLGAAVRLLVTAGDERTVGELTGGKDSRLVLAMLLGEGLASEVEFRTWGSAGLPDVVIASQLTERYGLDHRTGAGQLVDRTGRAPEWRRRGTDRSVAKSARTLDLEEQYRHHVWASSGAISLWDLHSPLWPPSGAMSLCGIGVEILSTNYAATDRVDRPERLARFVGRGGFVYDSARLLKTEPARALRTSVTREILAAGPAHGDARDAVDGYYVRGKFRRWSGAIAELDVRERVFALYDLKVIRDAFALGTRIRRSDALHHGLMEASAPGLAAHPFSGGGWAPDLLKTLPERVDLPIRSDGRTWLPPGAEIELYRVRRALHRNQQRTIASIARRRRSSGGRAAEENRMKDLARKKVVLRSLLDVPPGHATWDLYDRRRTFDALDRLESLTTQGRTEVHHAATVATWLDGGEQRADAYVRVTS